MKAEKKWVDIDWKECQECGNNLQAYTEGWSMFFDGDSVRCVECDMTGQISIDDNKATVNFHDWEETERAEKVLGELKEWLAGHDKYEQPNYHEDPHHCDVEEEVIEGILAKIKELEEGK